MVVWVMWVMVMLTMVVMMVTMVRKKNSEVQIEGTPSLALKTHTVTIEA